VKGTGATKVLRDLWSRQPDMCDARRFKLRCRPRRLVLAARHCDRVHGLLFGAIDVVDADVRNWSRNEGPAAGIATRVHDGLEGARGHLRAAVYALLTALDGVGVGGGGEGGDSPAPWEHSPCFAEQLNGAMELGEAMLKAGELVAETAGAREAAFGFIGGAK